MSGGGASPHEEAGSAKGCGWCGHGAGHTTDEHVARWGSPDLAPSSRPDVESPSAERGQS